MADKTWKKLERRIGKFFGTCRTPLSGISSRHTSSDIIHDKLYVECKLRKRFGVIELYKKCKPIAEKEGKTVVIALHQRNDKGDYLLIKKEDLLKVAGEVNDMQRMRENT